jgi:ketosteroid isomerase-like protein
VPQDNVAVVRRAQEAFARGDVDGALFAFDDDIQWHAAADEPDTGTHYGKAAVREYLTGWLEGFEGLTADVEEIIDAGGDLVVVPMQIRGRPGKAGSEVEVPETHVYRLEGGKIVETREYRTKAEALQAIEVGRG